MAATEVLQQFDACISSLEEEIALIEGGSCDDVALDALSSYSVKPEFMTSLGPLCTFPHLGEYMSSHLDRVPDSSSTPISEKGATTSGQDPVKGDEAEGAEVVKVKSGRGRPSKKRKMSESEPAPAPSPPASSPAPSSSAGTPLPGASSAQTNSPRRSKRAKRE